MISSLVTKEYWATSMLQLCPAGTFMGSAIKQYGAHASASIDYESGFVHYRSVWVTFFRKSMRIDFDGAARVDLPFVLPVQEMSRTLQNKVHVMAHKQGCYK